MTTAELFQELGIKYVTEGHHHCRKGWLQLDCPFCGQGTSKYHMGYSLSFHYFHCWRCGSHSAVATLVESTGLTELQVKKLLRDIPKSSPNQIEEPILKGKLKIPAGLSSLKSAHKRYLLNRDFSSKEIDTLETLWHVKALTIHPRLSWRIFIPIEYRGETVSWTTRIIKDKLQPRYITAGLDEESFPHRELLYGEDFARHVLIICEGPFDAWKIGAGAVSTLGTNYSKAQFNRMLRYPTRYVCFDNEPPAQKRANKLVDELSIYSGNTYNIQLDSNDPGSASQKELKKLRKLLK